MPPSTMPEDQTLILGAGSLGRLFAGYLAPVVPLTVLQRSVPASAKLAYTLITAANEPRQLTLSVAATDRWRGTASWVLVMTKAPDTEAAIASLVPRLAPQTPIVLFQNGMGVQQAIAERYPNRPILCASTTEGANRPDDSQVRHAGRGETWVGGLTQSGRDRSTAFAERLQQAGLIANPTDDIEARLWQKLAINAGINPFTAILDCTNGQILVSPYAQSRLPRLCAEIAAIATRSGYPMAADMLERRIRDVAQATRDNISSMLQDLRQRRPTEIDFINGYLLRQAVRYDIDAPVNRELVDGVVKAQQQRRKTTPT